MGNSTENANKKPTQTGLIDKTSERRWNMRSRKEKTTREKNNSTTWGNKPESTGERREIKDISTTKPSDFGLKYGNQENIKKRLNA